MNILKRPLPNGPGNITFILLGINILVFFLTYMSYRIAPYLALSVTSFFGYKLFWTPITYQFVHSGMRHILFNMLILLFVGRSLERLIGSWEFLLYYLLTGALGGLLSVVIYLFMGVNVLLVGASGSLYAVLLAFAVYFPNARFFIYGIIPVKSTHLILIYMAINIFPLITSGGRGGIAYLTHLFGFLFGAIYLRVRHNQRPLKTILGG